MFLVDILLMKCIFSPFYCIYPCRSLWKMLHICTLKLTEERALRVERADCCTCLLPWGFWRSDYAVMRLREWKICFRKGGSCKKKKKIKEKRRKNGVCMSRILSHQLCGGGIYFGKWVSEALLRMGARCCLRDLWCFHTTSQTRLN